MRYTGLGAPTTLALVFLLAGCGGRDTGPAPVFVGGAEVRGPMAAAPPPTPAPPSIYVKVERGQSLATIAHVYHVPQSVLIEANHLRPPYRVEAGSVLTIPGGTRPAAEPAPVAAASLPPPPKPEPPLARAMPEPKPLAAKPPPPAAALAPPSAAAPAPPPVAEAAPPERKPAAEAAAPPAHAGGNFMWPVHGRVLASYGTTAEGTHNDGINIAAPKGAPIEAADTGIVAYAGNELRGYGNLVLVKHANGWITAYAHCDLILVKHGQKVSRGQTIARVGASGSVSEPQLHFELRRGNHPVDPREFLEPLPTAGAAKSAPG